MLLKFWRPGTTGWRNGTSVGCRFLLLFFLLGTGTLLAQNADRTVRGTVTDATGEPLIGVNITVGDTA